LAGKSGSVLSIPHVRFRGGSDCWAWRKARRMSHSVPSRWSDSCPASPESPRWGHDKCTRRADVPARAVRRPRTAADDVPAHRPRLVATSAAFRQNEAARRGPTGDGTGSGRTRLGSMKRVAILGAGGMGTALAVLFAKSTRSVQLWARDPSQAAEIAQTRE